MCDCVWKPILGPICFLLYINDLLKVSSILTFYLFADGTNFLHSDPGPNSAVLFINKEMPKTTDWFNFNKLHLDINKSNAILFHPYQKTISTCNNMIRINDKTVHFSNSTKLFGI